MSVPTSSHPELPCAIAPYVPQTQGMCLLERLVAVSEERLSADITPSAQDPFATADGIPGWVGLEWLAQAVAAWAGWHAEPAGTPPPAGFLIGTRHFATTRDSFAFGAPVRVTITLDFRADNGLGHFHGELHDADGERLAHGDLTVFQPPSSSPLESAAAP